MEHMEGGGVPVRMSLTFKLGNYTFVLVEFASFFLETNK